MTQTELAPVDADVLRRLGALDACAVSDALDTLGLPGAVVGIRPLWPVGRVVAGRARTIQAAPKSEAQAGTHIASALIAVADAGDVAVIANGGREDVSCFGGILAEAAVERGMAGVAIDGACRDIAESDDARPADLRPRRRAGQRPRPDRPDLDGRAGPVRRRDRQLGRLRDRRPQRRRLRPGRRRRRACSTWPSASSPARRRWSKRCAPASPSTTSCTTAASRRPRTEAQHERAPRRQRPLDGDALGRARPARPPGQPARDRAAAERPAPRRPRVHGALPARRPSAGNGRRLPRRDGARPGRRARQRRPHRLHGLGRHPHRRRPPARDRRHRHRRRQPRRAPCARPRLPDLQPRPLHAHRQGPRRGGRGRRPRHDRRRPGGARRPARRRRRRRRSRSPRPPSTR